MKMADFYMESSRKDMNNISAYIRVFKEKPKFYCTLEQVITDSDSLLLFIV